MEIKQISEQINSNAKQKGFWPDNPNIAEKLMLIVSELAEAMEADRKDDHHNPLNRYRDKSTQRNQWVFDIVDTNPDAWKNWFNAEVKNTFEDELADAAIRIFDLAFQLGIDLEYHITAKMRYNETREYLHGKKY